MPNMLATALVGAVNTGTPFGAVERGLFTISISGTFSGVIQLRRSFADAPATGNVVKSYTAATEENGEAAEPQKVQLFCSTYGSGSPLLRLSQ